MATPVIVQRGATIMSNPTTPTPSSRGLRRLATAVGLAAGLLTTAPSSPHAQSADDRGIVGTWFVQVTLRNCQTNAPAGPAFNSLVTFHVDGTVTEAAATASFAPGQRTPGHGTWTRSGPRTYQQNMLALISFDTPAGYPVPPGGFLAGGQTVNQTVTLVDANHLTSAGTNAFYTTGLQLYRTGCSTADAVRFP